MADNNPWNDPVSDSPTPVKKKGMSGCMLASIIVGSLGLVTIIGCCGVFALFIRAMIPTETKVAAEVTAVGRQILNTEIPPDFTPEKSATLDNMFLTMRSAQFRHKENKGLIAMLSTKFKMELPPGNDPFAQLKQVTENEVIGTVDIKTTVTRDVMVNEQKVTISIGEGTDRLTGKAAHTARADFQQSNGRTVFIVRMDDDIWNEDEVVKMLEDAKAP